MNTPEELIPVIEWWQKDGKKTVVMFAVAGLAIASYYAWKNHNASLDGAAADKLSGVSIVEELEDAVAKFSGRDAESALKMKLAAAYCERGEEADYEKALEIYSALAESGNMPVALKGAPEMGKAFSLEALGKWADAAKAYAVVLAEGFDAKHLVFDAKLGAARCQAQVEGRDKALAALEELKKAYTDESSVARIDATIDVVKRWEKREKIAPPAPKAEETPAKIELDPSKVVVTPQEAPKAPAAPQAPAK